MSILKTLGVAAALLLGTARAQARPLEVVTTLPNIASIVEAVGGDDVHVQSIARGDQDPHFVDPKPSFLVKLSRADLLFVSGLDLEVGWLPPLLNNAGNPKILPGSPGYVDVSSGIEVLNVPKELVTRAEGDVHPLGNPHYWLDPENGVRIADTVAETLKKARPDAAALIDRNRAFFVQTLRDDIARWKARMKPFAGTKIVTYHDSWPYFARRFGLVVAGHVEPKPGVPPSPRYLSELVRKMPAEHVRLIIMEPYYSDSGPRLLSRQTGVPVLALPPSVGGDKGINTYEDLFEQLTRRLVEALSSGGPR